MLFPTRSSVTSTQGPTHLAMPMTFVSTLLRRRLWRLVLLQLPPRCIEGSLTFLSVTVLGSLEHAALACRPSLAVCGSLLFCGNRGA